MYDPPLGTAEEVLAFRKEIHANQFPADLTRCNRSLILYDDAMAAGLGYTARLLGRALLVAVREQRVLINAPHPTARWCGRPPYTLACHYEAWTHCPMPTNLSLATKWSHRTAFHDGRDLEPTGGGSGKGKGKGRRLAQRKVAKKGAESDGWYSLVRISTSQAPVRTSPARPPRLARRTPCRYPSLSPPVRVTSVPPCGLRRGRSSGRTSSTSSTSRPQPRPRCTSCSSDRASGCARRHGAGRAAGAGGARPTVPHANAARPTAQTRPALALSPCVRVRVRACAAGA